MNEPNKKMVVSRWRLSNALKRMALVVDEYHQAEPAWRVALICSHGRLRVVAVNRGDNPRGLEEEMPADGYLETTVNCDRLLATVKTDRNDTTTISFELLENNRLLVGCQAYAWQAENNRLLVGCQAYAWQAEMNCHDLKEFPHIPAIPEDSWERYHELSAEMFCKDLQYVTPAASTDRPGLQVVRFANGQMMASDGHRFHMIEIMPSTDHPAYCVPRRAMMELEQLLESSSSFSRVRVEVDKAKQNIRFHLCEGRNLNLETVCTLTARLAADDFPALDQVLPGGGKPVYKAHGPNLKGALLQIAETVNGFPAMIEMRWGTEMESDFVTIGAEAIELGVKIQAQIHVRALDARVEVEPGTVMHFNCEYLVEALAVAKRDVLITVAGPLEGLVIQGGKRFTAVVMPRRY